MDSLASQSIQFNNLNYLPLTNSSKWVLKGGAYLDDDASLVLPYNGTIEFTIDAFKFQQFSYYKIEVDAISEGFDSESSVDSDVIMSLKLNYTAYTGEISRSETCSMNIGTSVPINASSGEYLETKIMDTDNLPIHSCIFSIINNMPGYELKIKSVKLYVSEDYSAGQIINTVNTLLEQKEIGRVEVVTDDTETLLDSLEVFNSVDSEPTVIKPTYSGNKILRIDIGTDKSIVFTYRKKSDSVTGNV